MRRLVMAIGTVASLIGACASPAPTASTPPDSPSTLAPATTATATTTTTMAPAAKPTTTTTTTVTPTTTTLPSGVTAPPTWLGQRPLPLRPDGIGEVLPTPPELVDRRFAAPDRLPPPPDGSFASTIDEVPADVAARSTWDPACPIKIDDLRYITVSFRGFDGRPHTGELLVAAEAAEPIVDVFEQLYAADFPIEDMKITSHADLDAAPTGDGNVTSAFSCRPTVGAAHWSQHAYGLAVDVNPFQNPYTRDDIVIPELASAYVDRSDVRPGMILAGDAVTEAFASIGWGWGGSWTRPVDIMHFSANGR